MSFTEFEAFLHTNWGAVFLFVLFFLGGLFAIKGIHIAIEKSDGMWLFCFCIAALVILLIGAIIGIVTTMMMLGWVLALVALIIGAIAGTIWATSS